MDNTTDNAASAQEQAQQHHNAAAASAEAAQTAADNGNFKEAGQQVEKAEESLAKARDQFNVDHLQEQIKRLEADNRKLKDENGERRVTAKKVDEQNAKLRKVAQLLGFESDDDDPEHLLEVAKKEAAERAKERDELQAKLNRLEEDSQLRKVVENAGGSPDIVVPYLRGSGDLPTWGEEGWQEKAAQLAQTTLERNPQLRANHAPRTSGNAPTPTKGEHDEPTREDYQRLAAEGKWDEINKLSERFARRNH